MKRIVLVVLALILALSLGACAPRQDQAAPTPTPTPVAEGDDAGDDAQGQLGDVRDGTYNAEGDPWQYGQENATVRIENGRMAEITLRRLTKEGEEVNYDEWIGEEFNGAVRPDLRAFRIEMANRMVDQQTFEVDSISGATVTADNWKLAVQRCLEQARQQQ